MKKVLALFAVAGVATAASAQSLSMPAGLSVDSGTPSVTFNVSLSFDAASYFAFAGYDGASNASAGTIAVSGPAASDPLFFVANGNNVISGQLHFPPGVNANPANPFDIFEATFTANDFTSSYTVDITTATNQLSLYNSASGPQATAVQATELAGTIQVIGVPAPSSLALVGLGGLVATRRRR